MRLARLLAAVLLAVLAVPAGAARAHGGEARIELGRAELAPGMSLEVRGINIAAEQQITVALVGAQGEVVLGVVLGDAHGDFTQVFALPEDLAPGEYIVRALGANQAAVSAPLRIAGAPVGTEEEGTGGKDEDDTLLAPMEQVRYVLPTQAPAVGPAAPASLAGSPTLPATPPYAALGALALVAGALALVVRRALPRS